MSKVVTQLRMPTETNDRLSGVTVAVLEGEDGNGQPLVRWGRGRDQAGAARAVWMASPPDWSTCNGLQVVLAFEDGDETKPIVLGLLDTPPRLEVEEELATAQSEAEAPAPEHSKPKVLRIESEQELVLECGKAKIALRADGRVVILGGYVLSRSKGVNKIKGGSVQIN